MRKYYIFFIQPKTKHNYKRKSACLYTLLNRLRKTKKGNERGSLALYNQICEPFNLTRFYDYFMKKYSVPKQKHYYFIDTKKEESYLLELNPSCLVLLTKKNFPPILKILSYYSPHLFVCDFENGDYIWLEDMLMKEK